MIKFNASSFIIQNRAEEPVINYLKEEKECYESKETIITAGIPNPLRVLLILTTLFVVLCDQLSKIWVSAHVSLFSPVDVFDSYVRLFLVHNHGIIWGIPIRNNLVYFILPLIGIAVVLYIALKTHSKFLMVCYGLLLGGAVGNLLDRVRHGYVIDFIDIGIRNARWPTFNLADLAIIIGLIMIIVREIFHPKSIIKPL